MNNKQLEQLEEKAKEVGFKGKPLVVERYKNKNFSLTGDDAADIEAGRLAIKIGEQMHRSPAVGDIYFKMHFTKIE